MRCFAVLFAGILAAAWWPGPASADAIISGPGCAIDGNTVQVGSKRKGQKCWGGINVRLHGSVAKSLNEQCTGTDGKSWPCGQQARDALVKLMRQHSITCYHLDGEFSDGIPVVTCISGRRDLALELVQKGLAEATHDDSKRYELEEKDAKEARRGIWK